VALHNGGHAYLTGMTDSADFPTASPLESALGPPPNPDENAYSTAGPCSRYLTSGGALRKIQPFRPPAGLLTRAEISSGRFRKKREGTPMTRTHGIFGVVLLATFLAAGYSILVGSEPPNSAPAVLPATQGAEEELVCRDGAASATPDLEAAACSKCPPGQPKCFRDRDCDSVCGGRVEGSCVQINSCIRCCLCAT
jgi:hypothetical protein